MTQKWLQRTALVVYAVLMCVIASCGGGDGANAPDEGMAFGEAVEGEAPIQFTGGKAEPTDFGYIRNETGTGVLITYYTGTGSEVALPEKIEELPVVGFYNSAFQKNERIRTVAIPGTVTTIPYQAFYQCEGLQSVTIAEGVQAIGDNAFNECTNLSSVTLSAGLQTIGNSAFVGSALSSIEIPEGVTSIGASAFDGIRRLTSVKLPETLTSVGAYAFDSCRNLLTLNVPAALTDFPIARYQSYSYAFRGCDKLPIATRDALKARGYTVEGTW